MVIACTFALAMEAAVEEAALDLRVTVSGLASGLASGTNAAADFSWAGDSSAGDSWPGASWAGASSAGAGVGASSVPGAASFMVGEVGLEPMTTLQYSSKDTLKGGEVCIGVVIQHRVWWLVAGRWLVVAGAVGRGGGASPIP